MPRIVRKPIAFLALVSLACTLALSLTAHPVSACICARPTAFDSVNRYDVVFVGTVLPATVDQSNPVWTVAVSDVIKGEVGSQERLRGEDLGCGPNLGRYVDIRVFFAREGEGELEVPACAPVLTVQDITDSMLPGEDPDGSGPVAAIATGRYRLTNFALLDDRGRAIERSWVDVSQWGAVGAVAHCAGTTTAVVVSDYPDNRLTRVEMRSMTAIDQRSFDAAFWGMDGDRVACLDSGSMIVTASGFAPDTHIVSVASMDISTIDGLAARASFDDVSRAVIHNDGLVFLLPSIVDTPLRTLGAADLQPVPGGEYRLPAGTSTIDGDVSPDGTQLAVLARLDSTDIQWDSGASHILVIPLENGVPVAGPLDTIALPNAGATIFAPQAGAADTIRWIDDSSWIVEATTGTNNRIRIVATDGTHTVDNVYASPGRQPVPIGAGVLRATKGSTALVTPDGQTSIDPSAYTSYWISPVIDVPAFTPQPGLQAPPISIRPVAPGTASPRQDAWPQGAIPAEPGSDSWQWLPVVGVGVAGVAAVGLGVRSMRSRQR